MIRRDCTCGETADGVPLPELLAEGWKVWHAKEAAIGCYREVTYLTCPECSATIRRLERAVARGTLIS
jgi:hypothetical protein